MNNVTKSRDFKVQIGLERKKAWKKMQCRY